MTVSQQKFVITKIFTSFLILVCCNGLAEAGQRVLVVQSLSVAPYEEALSGFKSVCDAEITKVVLSDQEKINPSQLIQFNKPELILAIGMDALTEIKEIEDIPIIYMMVLNPQAITFGEKNISGISMTLSPERQVATLLEVLPATKTIGTLYNPDRTGNFIKEAVHAGLAVASRERDLLKLLDLRLGLKAGGDAIENPRGQKILRRFFRERVANGDMQDFDPVIASELTGGFVQWISKLCLLWRNVDISRYEDTAVSMLQSALLSKKNARGG